MFLKARHLYRNFFRHILKTTPFTPEPNTQKEVTKCSNSNYIVGACSMQGWRVTMEDSHVHILESPQDPKAAYFAVFDGHGGSRVAHYASKHLHDKIIGNKQYLAGNYHDAIKQGFLKLDEDLRNDQETKTQMCGATALTILIKDSKIYCGSAGDSRAVLCQQGKAVPLSFDHKPTNPLEMKRIIDAGGWVESFRVNGYLALSRALGDFIFKNNNELRAENQIVTALPDVFETPMKSENEFILLACDGIWDVLSNEEAVAFCRKRLSEGFPPEQVCQELIDNCLAPYYNLSGIGCDNMSVVLVCLLQGLSKDDYVERLKRKSIPTENNDSQNMHQL